jgi:molybdopterin/thiamine biosynthesis adenylyltransferase
MEPIERYSRQILFDGIGEAGQSRIARSKAAIIGCGALGAVHAETLARAGVGRIVLVDRDFVDESNLQRQIMFEERDALDRLPKAVAAAKRIGRVNSGVQVTPIVTDLTYENVEEIIGSASVVLDGTDNFETRFLINDACAKLGVPWIYGAAVGSHGVTMTIVPSQTPCLRCVFEAMPEPGSGPTCDTAGVIMPIVSVIGSIQAAEALKLITGATDQLHRSLIQVDVWDFRVTQIDLEGLADRSNCPACRRGEYEFLKGAGRQTAARLCGRDSVQVAGSGVSRIDFAALAHRLEPLGKVAFNEFLLRFQVEGYDITVFSDARSIIRGTTDPTVARGLYARYIGT